MDSGGGPYEYYVTCVLASVEADILGYVEYDHRCGMFELWFTGGIIVCWA